MAALEEEVSKAQLFKDVQFSMCDDVFQFENVKKLLLAGGAKFLNYLSDNMTYLIGDNPDHHNVSEAVEIYEKPVVTSRWVWLSAKALTLLPTSGFSPFKSQLFSNIIACPSNISGPDVQSLWAMVTYYGGSFRLQLEPDCTHLISTKPEGQKYDKAVQTNDRIKIVTPDWVIDSVKNKSICDEDLYHPRLLIFNNQSTVKSELIDVSAPSVTVTTGGMPTTSAVTSLPVSSGAPQLALRTVTLPSTAMITTFSIAQPGQTQGSPTTVQGGRVRVFLPPQHQVRLMQMKQNQIRQFCPPQMGQPPQQVMNVQQILQRQQLNQQSVQQQPLQQQPPPQVHHQLHLQQQLQGQPQQHPQQQLQQQQLQQQSQEIVLESGQQWNVGQASGGQSIVTSQPIQVISQSSPDLTKLRPVTTTVMSQQQPGQPRQVYLAVQQNRQQHFIQVQQQSQQRAQSNLIIQQRATHPNMQSLRLQQGPQQLIQLQQRQPISVQSTQYVRPPQQIIIQQQNQQAIQRQIQLQQQAIQANQQTPGQPPLGVGQPQIQQRMAAQRMPQQFVQQNQLRGQLGQPIRGPIAGQPILSNAMASGQPRVLMRAPAQYAVQGQQQFDGQQSPQQFIRGQPPTGPQLQFIRGQQWPGPPQDPNAPPQQHLTPMRPQHILVTTQQTPGQPTQQQILQWQQHQDIQRRQLMQQQNQQRFQVSIGTIQDKVRPTTSVVSVSSSANTESGGAVATTPTAATNTTSATVRVAQTPQTVSPNIALTSSQTIPSAVSVSAQVSPAYTSPNTTVASPVVNPKTKTALANLLNNRLQSGNSVQSRGDGNNSSQSGDGFPTSSSTTLTLSSTCNMSNKTGFTGAPGVAMSGGEVVQHLRPDDPHHSQNQMIQIRFYGIDPRLQIPADLCLLGCVFHISGYDKLVDTKLLDAWKKKLVKTGAELELAYTPKCTHVLCDNHQNPCVQQAIREGKRCVSAFWLNDVMAVKKMFPPSKAYHLPYALDENNKPCKHHIISMTGFEGEERVRVKEMILRTGAKFTSYLTQKNTIIVCKRLEGEKYRKSIEWRLAIVNLVWLQDVLFGHYDAQNLTNIPKKYQNFDLKDPFRIEYSLVPHLMNPWRQPLKVSEEYVKNRIAEKNENKIIKAEIMTKPEQSENIIKPIESVEETDEPNNKKLKLQTDLQKSPVSVQEESSTATPTVTPTVTNTSFAAIQTNAEEAKKIKVVLTSVKNNNKQELRSLVLSLGGRVVNTNDCTHLVSDRIARTLKFMCAFSSCKHVVTSDWVTESAKQNRFVDESEYQLNDTLAEKTFGFSLKHSLSIKNPQLFRGYVFYITNGCIPSPKVIKDIVESAGGRAVTTGRPTKRQLQRMQENDLKFCVISCDNDQHMCDIFFSRKIDVVNVELVLSGVLKQEIDFDLYAFKQNILKDN